MVKFSVSHYVPIWQAVLFKKATATFMVPHVTLHQAVESIFPPLEIGLTFVTICLNK